MEITKKTPVKIVQVQDIHGRKHTSIMLDLNYYFESKDKSNKKVKEFYEAPNKYNIVSYGGYLDLTDYKNQLKQVNQKIITEATPLSKIDSKP